MNDPLAVLGTKSNDRKDNLYKGLLSYLERIIFFQPNTLIVACEESVWKWKVSNVSGMKHIS